MSFLKRAMLAILPLVAVPALHGCSDQDPGQPPMGSISGPSKNADKELQLPKRLPKRPH
ncbi:hypothetical protein ACYOEI_42830 [Singulisphaera rosea]